MTLKLSKSLLLVLIGFQLSFIQVGRAQEHLEPDRAAVIDQTDYNHNLAKIFAYGLTPRVVEIRALVTPAFSESYMLGIKKEGEKFQLFLLEYPATVPFDKKVNGTPNTILIQRQITKDLTRKLYKIWENELLNVRHTRNRKKGLDGTRYQFSAFVKGHGEISGHTWSPADGTRMIEFVNLVDALKSYATHQSGSDNEYLRELISRLDPS